MLLFSVSWVSSGIRRWDFGIWVISSKASSKAVAKSVSEMVAGGR